jgi:hypothetical protein
MMASPINRLGPWLGSVLVFLAAVWLLIAPDWLGYRLSPSDWITAAVLAAASLVSGFWSIAGPPPMPNADSTHRTKDDVPL